jgi:hypothetical protein
MSYSFEIKDDLLQALDEYHQKSILMEKHIIEKKPFNGNLEQFINDDLIFNVPIYDMGKRKYAAFCSFTEAVWNKENDIKGNGHHFTEHDIKEDYDWFVLFYLFRLCGSGINYKPKTNNLFMSFIGTHGFGNFWIVNSILNQKYNHLDWLDDLKNIDKPFTDNKGYLLPQFSFENQKSNHLKKFILDYSLDLINHLYNFCLINKREIFEITDEGNKWLNEKGFKKQNFVLTAFAADLSEYFPKYVDPKSRVYAGTNATKCIKAIFPKTKKASEFDYINDVLQWQSERYDLNPIDCEDSRNCDPVRYFQEYQSKHHIEKNNGVFMKNNSILKQLIGEKQYYEFSNNLK